MPKCDLNQFISKFIEIPLQHGCSPANSLHIFRTPFQQNTSEWLLLYNIMLKISLSAMTRFLNVFFLSITLFMGNYLDKASLFCSLYCFLVSYLLENFTVLFKENF